MRKSVQKYSDWQLPLKNLSRWNNAFLCTSISFFLYYLFPNRYLCYTFGQKCYTDKIIGLEALVRWNNPDFGILLPDTFIPLAEENGFIFDLGEWVIRTACWQAKTWQRNGLQPVYISVNLSAQEFHPINLLKIIKNILFETKLDPEYLLLEITESAAMDNL